MSCASYFYDVKVCVVCLCAAQDCLELLCLMFLVILVSAKNLQKLAWLCSEHDRSLRLRTFCYRLMVPAYLPNESVLVHNSDFSLFLLSPLVSERPFSNSETCVPMPHPPLSSSTESRVSAAALSTPLALFSPTWCFVPAAGLSALSLMFSPTWCSVFAAALSAASLLTILSSTERSPGFTWRPG